MGKELEERASICLAKCRGHKTVCLCRGGVGKMVQEKAIFW